MVVGIEVFDFEFCWNILKVKFQVVSVEIGLYVCLNDQFLDFMVLNLNDNVCMFEGVVNCILLYLGFYLGGEVEIMVDMFKFQIISDFL